MAEVIELAVARAERQEAVREDLVWDRMCILDDVSMGDGAPVALFADELPSAFVLVKLGLLVQALGPTRDHYFAITPKGRKVLDGWHSNLPPPAA